MFDDDVTAPNFQTITNSENNNFKSASDEQEKVLRRPSIMNTINRRPSIVNGQCPFSAALN